MNLVKRLLAYLYLLIMVPVGVFFIMLSAGCFTLEGASETVSSLPFMAAAYAVVGIAIMFTGFAVPFGIIRNIRRNRIVTFRNPDGEVNITVLAIEDYIQKVAREIPSVSAAKARVSFSRKAVNIKSSVSIKAGSNIPEVTERIQMEVKNSLQSMLGVDEEINMIVHVSKIVGSVLPEKRPYGEAGATQVPYR